jgi:hypothetical protein
MALDRAIERMVKLVRFVVVLFPSRCLGRRQKREGVRVDLPRSLTTSPITRRWARLDLPLYSNMPLQTFVLVS